MNSSKQGVISVSLSLFIAMTTSPIQRMQAQGPAASSSVVTFVDAETPSGSLNGANTTFVLANSPSPAGSLALKLNGLQLTPNVDYTLSGNRVVFVPGVIPRSNDIMTCAYRTTLTALKVAGDGQSVTLWGSFGTAMQLSIQDGNSNPVQGAVVTFSAPDSGPSGTFSGGGPTATTTTDVGGIATAPPFSANGTTGRYSVSATVGSRISVSFSLANLDSNLAKNKRASQSSTPTGWPINWPIPLAGLAVDGNVDGNFYDASVTHTTFEANPWWQVDLGALSTVSSVLIWNRTDCCANRLSDYWVFVSSTPFAASDTLTSLQNRSGTWSSHQTVAPSPSVTIPTGGVRAQYVRVQLSGSDALSLAEVQVIGTSLANRN